MGLGPGDYLLGFAELLAVAGALVFGAVRVRAWLLRGWTGAPARVVEAVLAFAMLVWSAELLGAVGAFEEAPFVVFAVALGIGTGLLTGRRAAAGGGDAPPRSTPRPGPVALVLAALATAAVVAQWSLATNLSLDRGMYGFDTTWYHMPFAARFVQDGSLTGLHFTSTAFLSWFYPANSELAHATGILVFGRDILSPLINLGWLGLALLAAWSIGRPWGMGPVSLIGAAAVFGAGVFADQPGEARNDIPGAFFLLASAAVLVNASAARVAAAARPRLEVAAAPLAVAGIAAGLAWGTKLTLLAPVGALTLGVIAVAATGSRARVTAIWAAGLLAGGGFWFARNLVAVGNPLPWLASLGPLPLPGPEEVLPGDREPFTVIHYATDTEVWSDWFFPGLADRLGEAWPVVLALGGLGAALALIRGGTAAERVLGWTVIAAALAYPFTPLTASGPEGRPLGFESNLRYLAPILALALALLPIAAARAGRRWRDAVLAAMAAIFVVAVAGSEAWDAGSEGSAAIVGVGVLALLAAVSAARARRIPAPAIAAGAAVLVAGAIAAGHPIQRHYLEDRYAGPTGVVAEPGQEAAFARARALNGQRIATTTVRQYPLYGVDLSNRVQYVGAKGPEGAFTPIETCDAWREALNEGRYGYVVTGINFPDSTARRRPREEEWTRTDPAAREILSDRTVSVFRLDGELDSNGCASGGAGERGA